MAAGSVLDLVDYMCKQILKSGECYLEEKLTYSSRPWEIPPAVNLGYETTAVESSIGRPRTRLVC